MNKKLLLVVTLALIVIWAEVLCRLFTSPPTFHESPSFFNRLKGQRPRWHSEGVYKLGTPEKPRFMTVRTNSYGFRGDDFEIPKPAGLTRILCLGDSVTFGWGVNNEQTFPRLLQDLLRSRGSRTVEVLNAGIGDIGTRDEIAELPSFLTHLDIDLLVLGFFMNDSRPPQGFDDEFLYEGPVNRFFRTSRVVRASYALRFLYERSLLLRMKLRMTPELNQRFAWIERYKSRTWEKDPAEAARLIEEARYDWGAAWKDDSWAEVEADLRTLNKLSKTHGFKVVLVALPVSVQAYGAADDAPQRRLARIAEGFGWIYADPLPLMRKDDPRLLFFDQCHLTERGNRIVADSLAGSLEPVLRLSN